MGTGRQRTLTLLDEASEAEEKAATRSASLELILQNARRLLEDASTR